MGTVGLCEVCAIDSKEDVAGVGEVFHEGDAHFVGSHYGEIEVFVSFFDSQLAGGICASFVSGWCPPLCDGRH